MLYDLETIIIGAVLLLPLAVLGLAWARINTFYASHPARRRQRVLYRTALVVASVSALAYLGYWSWRVCSLYQIVFPFTVLIVLERFLYLSRVLSLVSIFCFILGRGPHRILTTVATFWITLQIWIHNDLIHWA